MTLDRFQIALDLLVDLFFFAEIKMVNERHAIQKRTPLVKVFGGKIIYA